MNLITQEELHLELCDELYEELYEELCDELYGEVYQPLGLQIRTDFQGYNTVC
jgi:hypothetical protein